MLTRLRAPLLLAVLVSTLTISTAACAGRDEGPASDVPPAVDETTTSTTEAPAPVGKGKGTFVVGDRTYAFEARRCLAEEGDPLGTVQVDGNGTFDGRGFTVTVKSSPGETSVIETVQIAFAATEAVVGTNFAPLPSGASDVKFEVEEEGRARGTIAVTGTGGQPSGEGTLALDCEAG